MHVEAFLTGPSGGVVGEVGHHNAEKITLHRPAFWNRELVKAPDGRPIYLSLLDPFPGDAVDVNLSVVVARCVVAEGSYLWEIYKNFRANQAGITLATDLPPKEIRR